MKQAWFTSVTAEERDQAMNVLRQECPHLELHPVGHTSEQDAHVNPFFVVRYEGATPYPPKFYNMSQKFPALQEDFNLLGPGLQGLFCGASELAALEELHVDKCDVCALHCSSSRTRLS